MPFATHGCERSQFGALLAVAPVRAETVAGFDDLPVPFPDFVLPTREPFAYVGLMWSGFYVVRSTHGLTEQFPKSGLRTGVVSGDFVAVASRRGIQWSEVSAPEGERFDFHGAQITAGWRSNLNLTIEGLVDGTAVYTEKRVINPGDPQALALEYRNVDAVRIWAEGGEDAGLCKSPVCDPGPEVVIDDFSFTLGGSRTQDPSEALLSSAPEPAEADPVPETPVDQPLPKPKPMVAQAPKEEPPEPSSPKPSPEPIPTPARPTEPATAMIEPAASDPETSCGGPYFGVQVGAFRSKPNAINLRERLAAERGSAQVHQRESDGSAIFVVVVGCHADKSGAAGDFEALSSAGTQGFVVRATPERLGPIISP